MRRLAVLGAMALAGCVLRADGPEGQVDAAGAAIDAAAAVPDAAGSIDAAPPVDASCDTPAPTEGDVLTARRVGTFDVFVDGVLDDAVWQYAHRVEFDHATLSDNAVVVYTVWDDEAIYFGYEVTDASIEAIDGELHLDDGAEIYLDTEHDATPDLDADDYHFIVNTNLMSVGGVLVPKLTTPAGGYVMEIGIPWQTLAVTPAPGLVMGLLLGNNDRDAGLSEQFDWLGLIDSGPYARPNLWGDLALSGDEAGAGCP